MKTNLIRKTGYALLEVKQSFRKTSTPLLVMTLLVKNEEEMLEKNLQFHKAMGVDFFLVTDNNSTDRTPEILEKYSKLGWIKEIIRETATNYEQKVWVDRMVWLAKKCYHADWVINGDADELWYAPSGNLKTELSKTRANVLRCEVRSVYPIEDKPFWLWDHTIRTVHDPEKYGLSIYSVFERQNYKVIHRTAGYMQISMGNHKVRMFPYFPATTNIVVYHYNVRSKQTFISKMVNGGQQLEQRKKQHGGRHWRYFYNLYKEGKLEAEYDRVIGKNVYNELCRDGYIVEDCTIPKFFAQLNC